MRGEREREREREREVSWAIRKEVKVATKKIVNIIARVHQVIFNFCEVNTNHFHNLEFALNVESSKN
jgi:hypothetical protein